MTKMRRNLNSLSLEENFDLYLMAHSAYSRWLNWCITPKIIASHRLDDASNLLDQYYKLGSQFADIGARTITNEQGFVEFH